MKLVFVIALIVVASGCASKPSAISLAVVDDIDLAQVLDDDAAYQGATVRWGGIVTEVENKADETWVFVVGRELKDDEKPVVDSASDGRFVARFNGFKDPLVYKSGRPLTVVGRLDGSLKRPIGEFMYHFPVVAVRDSHLWAKPVRAPQYYYPPPLWHHPYYYHPYPHRRYW